MQLIAEADEGVQAGSSGGARTVRGRSKPRRDRAGGRTRLRARPIRTRSCSAPWSGESRARDRESAPGPGRARAHEAREVARQTPACPARRPQSLAMKAAPARGESERTGSGNPPAKRGNLRFPLLAPRIRNGPLQAPDKEVRDLHSDAFLFRVPGLSPPAVGSEAGLATKHLHYATSLTYAAGRALE